MFEPGQQVFLKPFTRHNIHSAQRLAHVVRMMAGDQIVILDIGDILDVRVRVQDVELESE